MQKLQELMEITLLVLYWFLLLLFILAMMVGGRGEEAEGGVSLLITNASL